MIFVKGIPIPARWIVSTKIMEAIRNWSLRRKTMHFYYPLASSLLLRVVFDVIIAVRVFSFPFFIFNVQICIGQQWLFAAINLIQL